MVHVFWPRSVRFLQGCGPQPPKFFAVMKLRDDHTQEHQNFFHNWAKLSPDDLKGIPLPFLALVLFLFALMAFGVLA